MTALLFLHRLEEAGINRSWMVGCEQESNLPIYKQLVDYIWVLKNQLQGLLMFGICWFLQCSCHFNENSIMSSSQGLLTFGGLLILGFWQNSAKALLMLGDCLQGGVADIWGPVEGDPRHSSLWTSGAGREEPGGAFRSKNCVRSREPWATGKSTQVDTFCPLLRNRFKSEQTRNNTDPQMHNARIW